jgi:hypothetical protein
MKFARLGYSLGSAFKKIIVTLDWLVKWRQCILNSLIYRERPFIPKISYKVGFLFQKIVTLQPNNDLIAKKSLSTKFSCKSNSLDVIRYFFGEHEK